MSLEKILLANGVVLIVPGLNFVLVSRLSGLYGKVVGLQCAAGITLAIMLHVMLAIFGSYKLFIGAPFLFKFIKVLGAVYITYMAIMIFFKPRAESEGQASLTHPIIQGFMVDILNPFVMLFYVSLFAQIISKQTSYSEILSYITLIFCMTLGWFSIVALLFGHHWVRQFILERQSFVSKVSAIILLYFGIKLFLATV